MLNGIYPIGRRQAYQNTSDGLNYAIMLRGKCGLKAGTFVTFGCGNSNNNNNHNHHGGHRLIEKASCAEDVIGVITATSGVVGSAGFVANAGQFAAADRIGYNEYHSPLVQLNISGGSGSNFVANVINGNSGTGGSISDFSAHISANVQQNTTINFPANLTITRSGVDRTVQYIPYDQRSEYYQVALSGLVVVKADFKHDDKNVLKCGVKNGKAVPGNNYFIVQFIDKKRVMILLK